MKLSSAGKTAAALLAAALCTAAWAQVDEPLPRAQRPARGAAQAERASRMNAAVLQLHKQVQEADARSRPGLRMLAVEQLRARANALRDLARSNPAEVLRFLLDSQAAAALRADFPELGAEIEQHGEWEGPVDTLVFDSEDLEHHDVVHHLRADGGEILEVRMADPEPEGIECGKRARFRGVRIGDVVVAEEGEVSDAADAALTADARAAAAPACGPRGQQNIAVLLVTFPGVAAPSNVTPSSVHSMLFGASGRSLHGYWNEASYGQTSASGTVLGWYTLDRVYTCNEYYAMRNAAIAAADADIDFRNYNRLFIIFPNPGGCSWAGISNVGCSSFGSADGTIPASSSWMLAQYFSNTDNAVKLSAHEGGHALGLMHARSRRFTGEPLAAPGTAGTISEYGDVHSSMGSWNLGHYNVEQKIRLGWLSSANVQQVQSAGTYLLQPLELPASGVQALQVLRGTGGNAWLWLEFRQPLGNYDNSLNSQVFSGALIHYKDSNTGTYTDLLDFTSASSSFSDAALAAGSSWQDPYTNVSISAVSASPSGLSVSVGYGASPCAQSAPTVTLSPPNPSAQPGGSAAYTVNLKNNDSAACGSRTFGISSTLPQGWTTTFSSSSVTLAPGQSTNVTMTKSVPPATAPATYSVNVAAQSQSSAVTATASLTVLAPCSIAAPTLSLSPSNPSAQPGSSVSYTLSIRNNDSSSCSSRPFNLSSTLPQGWTTTFFPSSVNLAPGQSMTVTMTKTVPAAAAATTYPVNAVAQSQSGSTSASASVTVVAPPSLSVAFTQSAIAGTVATAANFTVRVLSGSSPASGARVTFTIRKPGGAVESSQAIRTDARGTASWTYRFQNKDPKGVYTVTAAAAFNNQTATATASVTLR